ncbi:MAG: fibronectin type III domain-containing protein [Candidatus Eisenbacteria bacterium]|nr:fibronectin type III domain-containing protein [Candidatus Eisenbacteria bacterium]
MRALSMTLIASAVLIAGCHDQTAPRDLTPPAAPRGFYSVTGDQSVTLRWLGNTEADLSGYRVYMGDCASGSACPYTRVGSTTATSITLGGLVNGQTRYFAVSAVDRAGNESDLSYDTVSDTPRPAGAGRVLTDVDTTPSTSGYDFSAYVVRPWNDPSTDMYFQISSGVARMVCPFTDTDIQDAGYATTLDAVDFAPSLGWSATGTVELIPWHCYVVRIGGVVANYAKFRVTGVTAGQVVFDWAYQTDPGNRQLKSRPSDEAQRERRTVAHVKGGERGNRI